MKNIYGILKELRIEKGLSQKEIADKLNMAQNNYSKLERGEISLTFDRFEEIAKVLETPIHQILSDGSYKSDEYNALLNFFKKSRKHYFTYYFYIESILLNAIKGSDDLRKIVAANIENISDPDNIEHFKTDPLGGDEFLQYPVEHMENINRFCKADKSYNNAITRIKEKFLSDLFNDGFFKILIEENILTTDNLASYANENLKDFPMFSKGNPERNK